MDYTFKRRLGLILISLGVALLLAAAAIGFAVGISIPTADGDFKLNVSTGDTPSEVLWVTGGLAVLLIVAGLWFLVLDRRDQSRKKVIVIETRGLRDTSGTPLLDAVPSSLTGRRISLLINLRQGQDGRISEPEEALRRIRNLPYDIANHEGGVDRTDVQFVLGGLAPVPFSFLVGVLVDDESAVTLMDWNRHHDRWSELNEPDDGRRFTIAGLDAVPPSCAEVVMAVSVSYGADLAGIAAKFGPLS